MYGGDEVAAVVLDVGSNTTKAGYAGEDTPKAVFPSALGVMKADGARKFHVNDLNFRRDGLDVTSAFQGGLTHDWEGLEALWGHALHDRLRLDVKDHPLLIAEPTATADPDREKLVTLAFEKFHAPAVFLAKAAVLTAFASGRASALVLDCGAQAATAAAVHDGYVLRRSLLRSPLGGDVLSEALLRSLESRGAAVRPRYGLQRREVRPGEYVTTELSLPGTTPSYRRFRQLEIVGDIKEVACRVAEQAFSAADTSALPPATYELPDGSTIDVGADRFRVPEILFQPELLEAIAPGLNAAEMAGMGAASGPLKSLPHLVKDCLARCDPDVHKELYGGILLTGGGSLFPSLRERLEKDVADAAPSLARVKVSVPSTALERKYAVWIGGSILASLGSFQQMWMSRQEFLEHGPGLILKKAP